jgi:hypothetical protein
MNVAFYHRSIHPQLLTLRHSSLLRQFHHPLVQLLNDPRPDYLPQSGQGLRVRHFFIPDPSKRAIHQIGPHLAFQHVIAPVPDMFQQQQAERDFRRRLHPATAAALRVAFSLSFVHRIQELLIFQKFVHQPHPRFPQALDILGQTSMPQRRLLMT